MGRTAGWVLVVGLLTGAHPAQAFEKKLSYALAPGSKLRVEMKYGQLRIVGSQAPDVRVKIYVDERQTSLEEIVERLQVRYQPGGKEAQLRISGMKNPRVEVLIPSETHLRAHLRAGELRIQGVTGDLQANLWAGEMDLEVPEQNIYRFVRAHVGIGSVGHPFAGKTTGWLGKKFEAGFTRGRYRLDASVGVGDLSITPSRTRPMAKTM